MGNMLKLISFFSVLILFAACGSDTRDPSGGANPVRVVIDVHCDPLIAPLTTQEQVYHEWVDAATWALDAAEARGAKISFLSDGTFMEWVLEEQTEDYPLIRRLYASGGTIGTHSHFHTWDGPHDWRDIGLNPATSDLYKSWDDHTGIVNAVISGALDVTDTEGIKAINNTRGSHIPGDHAARINMMAEYGFGIHEPGPEEDFYGLFNHYVMNPYRPSGGWFLAEDPSGPVVVVPTGSVLGLNQMHKDILQDNRMPAKQARFLLELLNWLHNAHVAGTGRLWTFGWGSHCHDYLPGAPTREAFVPMLDWLNEHFIGKQAGGRTAAAFSSYVDVRDAYYAWEASHAGESSFDYPVMETDWNLYPYLEPAARYLAHARYENPMPSIGTVRWHALTAGADSGDPYPIYVLYTGDGLPATVDLSPWLGMEEFKAVDPATGESFVFQANAVEVSSIGTILVPPGR